jgi:hypothetical protein
VSNGPKTLPALNGDASLKRLIASMQVRMDDYLLRLGRLDAVLEELRTEIQELQRRVTLLERARKRRPM